MVLSVLVSQVFCDAVCALRLYFYMSRDLFHYRTQENKSMSAIFCRQIFFLTLTFYRATRKKTGATQSTCITASRNTYCQETVLVGWRRLSFFIHKCYISLVNCYAYIQNLRTIHLLDIYSQIHNFDHNPQRL